MRSLQVTAFVISPPQSCHPCQVVTNLAVILADLGLVGHAGSFATNLPCEVVVLVLASADLRLHLSWYPPLPTDHLLLWGWMSGGVCDPPGQGFAETGWWAGGGAPFFCSQLCMQVAIPRCSRNLCSVCTPSACLPAMAEPFASAHDGFLRRYIEEEERCQRLGRPHVSGIVGSGRDVMARDKSGPCRCLQTLEEGSFSNKRTCPSPPGGSEHLKHWYGLDNVCAFS